MRAVVLRSHGGPEVLTIEDVAEPKSVPLCGNSIGTDRRFLAAYLPEIEDYLHYRSIDVSSVKELVKRWYPSVDARRPHGHGSHRALDDIRNSIEELRYYRTKIFLPPEIVLEASAEAPAIIAEDSAELARG